MPLYKRLLKSTKKQIAKDSLFSNKITDVAKEHGVTRKTVYQYQTKAHKAIDQSFENKKGDDVLFQIPVTKKWLATVVVLLFIINKSSNRDSKLFMKLALDVDISVGSINTHLDNTTKKAKAVNDSYHLNNCTHSATDELFHRNKPVLAAVDLDSQFCLKLALENNRDGTTWGCHLLDMQTKGYNPEANIMDGGSGMAKGFEEALPEVEIRYDHFHVIKEIKDTSRYLKNKLESAQTDAIKASIRMDKAKAQGKHQKECYNLHKATKILSNYEFVYQQFTTLTNWLQYDILQLQSINSDERYELYDFILEELSILSKRYPHRITPIVTTLKNNKEKLLKASQALNKSFQTIATNHNIELSKVWDICNNARYNLSGSQYAVNLIKYHDQYGDHFDRIEDDVLQAIANEKRSSSLIETLNSRLRPYLDPRKGFKPERLELIMFALNHLPRHRSTNENLKGKSSADLFLQKEHLDPITLLGLEAFKKAA